MLREDGYHSVGLETDDVLEAFQVLYQSGGCIEAFHKHRGTRSLVISPWHAGTRQVDYELSIKAPAFVTNIVGTDLSVKESQTVTWTDALGNTVPDPFQAASTPRAASSVSSDSVVDGPTCYTIRSVPVIQTTGSDRFVTELAFQFTKAPNTHKVSVSCSLQVEAKIWGLQSTLEPYMLSEAKKQLSEFIPFLTSYFCEEAHVAATSPKAPHSSAGSTATPVDLMSQTSRSSSEHFYDALEEVPKGVRAAVQIFEAVKEDATPRAAASGRLPSKSPHARSRPPQSPLARPASPLPRPAAVETKAPATPPEPAIESPAVPPAEAMHDDNAKLQLEVAALRLDAAERRFQGLADATEACLRHLRDSAPAPAAAAAPPVHRSVDLASWRSGAGVGFVVGVACGLGAAALLTWGGGRGTHQYRAGR